jgi:deoxyuridine 5'-triphosphate nucleotidohydrolase
MSDSQNSEVVVPSTEEAPTKNVVRFSKADETNLSPFCATEGSAGFDLAAKEGGVIRPGQTKLVGTGLRFEVPVGSYLNIVPRSGLSLKTTLWLRNSPGTLDSDYRGECGLILHNYGNPYRDFFIFSVFLFLSVLIFQEMDNLYASIKWGPDADGAIPIFSMIPSYFMLDRLAITLPLPLILLWVVGWGLRSLSSFHFNQGDRLAQGILLRYADCVFQEVTQQELTKTERGDGGYGHTGVRTNNGSLTSSS